jgi:hypothetical protein
MTGLVKGLIAAVGGVASIVAANVISKDEEERKKWLKEMGDKVDNAFDSLGKTVDKAVDNIKGALD